MDPTKNGLQNLHVFQPDFYAGFNQISKVRACWVGDDVEAFSGSQTDLKVVAENLFLSPPHPQPLRFESLSFRTPQSVPPTPGTALQNTIESKLEKPWVTSSTSNSKWDLSSIHAGGYKIS